MSSTLGSHRASRPICGTRPPHLALRRLPKTGGAAQSPLQPPLLRFFPCRADLSGSCSGWRPCRRFHPMAQLKFLTGRDSPEARPFLSGANDTASFTPRASESGPRRGPASTGFTPRDSFLRTLPNTNPDTNEIIFMLSKFQAHWRLDRFRKCEAADAQRLACSSSGRIHIPLAHSLRSVKEDNFEYYP